MQHFLMLSPSFTVSSLSFITADLVARTENPRYIRMLSVCCPCKGGAAAHKAACFVCIDFDVYVEHIVTLN